MFSKVYELLLFQWILKFVCCRLLLLLGKYPLVLLFFIFFAPSIATPNYACKISPQIAVLHYSSKYYSFIVMFPLLLLNSHPCDYMPHGYTTKHMLASNLRYRIDIWLCLVFSFIAIYFYNDNVSDKPVSDKSVLASLYLFHVNHLISLVHPRLYKHTSKNPARCCGHNRKVEKRQIIWYNCKLGYLSTGWQQFDWNYSSGVQSIFIEATSVGTKWNGSYKLATGKLFLKHPLEAVCPESTGDVHLKIQAT